MTNFFMKKALSIIFMAVTVAACGTAKRAVTSDIEERNDSLRIEYRERIVLVPDTVFVEIPAQTAERMTGDSLSHLENDYAESNARINPDGSLFHDLKTKPQAKPVPIRKEIHQRDSIERGYRAITKTSVETVEVEKPLTAWQKFRLDGFWALLAAVAGAVLWKFRKPLSSIFLRL